MSFFDVERGLQYGAAALVNTVRINSSGSKGKERKQAVVAVSSDIFKKLGSPRYFHLMIGTKEHSGLVAMVPKNVRTAASYAIILPKKGNGAGRVGISASKLGITPSAITKPVTVPFEITQDGLILDLRSIRPAVNSNGLRSALSEHMVAAE